MPTLVEFDVPANERFSAAGTTAQASDLIWMANELDSDDGKDDSTLSGTLLIAALDDMRNIQQMSKKRENPSESEDSVVSVSTSVLAHGVSTHSETEEPTQQKELMQDSSACSRTFNESYFVNTSGGQIEPCVRMRSECEKTAGELDLGATRPRKERARGPMEKEYTSSYQELVNDSIRKYRNQHGDANLPDYRSMNLSERQYEHNRVLKLLRRLNISPMTDEEDYVGKENVTDSAPGKHARKLASPTDTNGIVSRCDKVDNQSETNVVDSQSPAAADGENDMSTTASFEKSMALLTPPPQAPEVAVPLSDNAGSWPSSPIEIARSMMQYESPANDVERLRKRMATTSGKRGADLTRARLESNTQNGVRFQDADASAELETPFRRLSIQRSKIFSSSQSPISPDGSIFSSAEGIPSQNSPSRDISFGEDDSDTEELPERHNDTIERNTMTQDRRVRWELSGRPLNTAVHLKAGRTAHFCPLDIAHNRKARNALPTQTFPDPFGGYSDRCRRRLDRMFKWIRRLDGKESEGGLVLSLQNSQVIDIALKLLCESQTSSYHYDSTGQTLIVARTKGDLDEWGRALREGTALSVLNHSTLPWKERKSHVSVAKCANYDVVLSTFDAMKSPDSNITMDGTGIASVKTTDDEGSSWHISRSQSEPLECKRLSVLHKLRWRRVLFIDILGKKCYMAKPGTSRASAARAISSFSRYDCLVVRSSASLFLY